MRRFSFVLIIIFLVAGITGGVYYIKVQNDSSKTPLQVTDAFNYSGAKMLVNNLYIFVRLPSEYKDLKSLTGICEEVFKELDITRYSNNPQSTDTLTKSDLQAVNHEGVKVSMLAMMIKDKQKVLDRYITIETTSSNDGKAVEMRDSIERVLLAHDLKPNVNCCITGTFDGRLGDAQLEEICQRVLKDSAAKKVNSQRDTSAITVSAFSPLIKDTISVQGKSVNLGLVIRYNKVENKTYMWVATPVVNSEY